MSIKQRVPINITENAIISVTHLTIRPYSMFFASSASDLLLFYFFLATIHRIQSVGVSALRTLHNTIKMNAMNQRASVAALLLAAEKTHTHKRCLAYFDA